MAQTALCICSRNWKTKLIVVIYFGTETSKFCFRIISFSSLVSVRVKFRFDRACSTTVNSLLKLSFESNLQYFKRRRGKKTYLGSSCLYIRNGKLDTKCRGRQTKIKAGKKTQGLL